MCVWYVTFQVSNRHSDVAVRYFEDLFEHSSFFFFFFLSKELFWLIVRSLARFTSELVYITTHAESCTVSIGWHGP